MSFFSVRPTAHLSEVTCNYVSFTSIPRLHFDPAILTQMQRTVQVRMQGYPVHPHAY